jgi:hypothetical protein
MKKIIAILALATFGTAFAADYVSVDVDNVRGLQGASDSTAQTIRIGKGFGDYQLGLQSRLAKFDGGGAASSVEITGAKNSLKVAGITPFVGFGHDNLANYNYGLVGATYGRSIGPGFAMLGVKTRVGSTEAVNTKQTVTFATYSIPVAKSVAVNLNASKSYQDIKENAYGLGLAFNF